MSSVLTVVDGLGTQGLSVIETALQHRQYRVRALVREPGSPKARALKQRGVEVIDIGIADEKSLVKAFKGSTAIFAVTDFYETFEADGPNKASELEAAKGIRLADAAMKTPTLKHYIWSTLPNSSRISNGAVNAPHFAGKNRVDEYIKQRQDLCSKTTFLWAGWFDQSLQYPVAPSGLSSSAASNISGAACTPVQTRGNTSGIIGVFVLAILKQPNISLPGKVVVANAEISASEETNNTESNLLTNPYQLSESDQQASLQDFDQMWPLFASEVGLLNQLVEGMRNDTWSGGEALVTKDDLGITEEELAAASEGDGGMDWASAV